MSLNGSLLAGSGVSGCDMLQGLPPSLLAGLSDKLADTLREIVVRRNPAENLVEAQPHSRGKCDRFRDAWFTWSGVEPSIQGLERNPGFLGNGCLSACRVFERFSKPVSPVHLRILRQRHNLQREMGRGKIPHFLVASAPIVGYI